MKWKWLLWAAAFAAPSALARERFAPSREGALFYYDLGPDRLDVSEYPYRQKDNYEVFVRTCSRCHTLARAINAPIVGRKEWGRYVRAMHVRKKEETGIPFPSGEAEAVINFLTYDSGLRKDGRNKDSFLRQTLELQELFDRGQRSE